MLYLRYIKTKALSAPLLKVLVMGACVSKTEPEDCSVSQLYELDAINTHAFNFPVLCFPVPHPRIFFAECT